MKIDLTKYVANLSDFNIITDAEDHKIIKRCY